MKNIKRSSKDEGIVLPIILMLITILIWTTSLLLLAYKNNIKEYKALKEFNNDYWDLENLSLIAEYELFKADKLINEDKYRDIIEYFEGEELVWISKDTYSKSGYTREKIKHNSEIKDETIKLNQYSKNILEIKLIKKLNIDSKDIKIAINLYYEYPYGEINFYKSSERKIERIGVEYIN